MPASRAYPNAGAVLSSERSMLVQDHGVHEDVIAFARVMDVDCGCRP